MTAERCSGLSTVYGSAHLRRPGRDGGITEHSDVLRGRFRVDRFRMLSLPPSMVNTAVVSVLTCMNNLIDPRWLLLVFTVVIGY